MEYCKCIHGKRRLEYDSATDERRRELLRFHPDLACVPCESTGAIPPEPGAPPSWPLPRDRAFGPITGKL